VDGKNLSAVVTVDPDVGHAGSFRLEPILQALSQECSAWQFHPYFLGQTADVNGIACISCVSRTPGCATFRNGVSDKV
jgi:hypothetical protein